MELLLDIAGLIWPLVAAYGLYLADRRARDVLADRAAVREAERSQRTSDVEALRAELGKLKGKVNALALKQGIRGDE